jgi:uncharacterized protein with ParB-like and HNH nuclease domain
MGTPIISLREYLEKTGENGRFIIPDYQRGYIWGQVNLRDKMKEDSVNYMLNSLLSGFEEAKNMFIQGITVHEDSEKKTITLVDGQQRTTFFFLLLEWLNAPQHFVIDYSIRGESDKFLKNLNAVDCSLIPVSEDEKYQDVYFFKKTLNTFQSRLGNFDVQERKAFLEYLLEKVKFLYIVLPNEEKAKIVFTMMNGNKADMQSEELVKSELLRCSSLKNENIGEAENTAIRGRLAREWDQWLYWWNDKNVQEFFHVESQLGWLLPLFMRSENVSFDEFRKKKLANASVKESKAIFKALRLLQKSIEDAYSNPITYNYIGAILCIRNSKQDRYRFLRWYFIDLKNEKNAEVCSKELKRYFDWAVLNINHEDIDKNNYEEFGNKKNEFVEKLADDSLYFTSYETGARWLLRCNIEQDCNQGIDGRKFDFSIWDKRSLEHIFPKSKVGHQLENGVLVSQNEKNEYKDKGALPLWREDIKFDENGIKHTATEHSIGNLVLLYKDDNSKFSDADFQTKKNIFFETENVQTFKSRHLIHTISVFAHSNWDGEQIARNKKAIIDAFNDYYKKYEKNYLR